MAAVVAAVFGYLFVKTTACGFTPGAHLALVERFVTFAAASCFVFNRCYTRKTWDKLHKKGCLGEPKRRRPREPESFLFRYLWFARRLARNPRKSRTENPPWHHDTHNLHSAKSRKPGRTQVDQPSKRDTHIHRGFQNRTSGQERNEHTRRGATAQTQRHARERSMTRP